MIITIDNTFHIRVDGRNYILVETYVSEKDNSEREKNHGYFMSVESALTYLARLKVVSSDSKVSLGKYIRSLKEVTDELVRAVGGV